MPIRKSPIKSDRFRKRVHETCDQEIVMYQANQTPRKAIETASRLQQACCLVDADIGKLDQEREDAQELYRLFEPWRMLAYQIDGDRQLMVKSPEDSAVQNFIQRFDVVQQRIRDYLGEKRISLKDVLGNHEHFKGQIDKIKAEFDQYLVLRHI